MYVRSSPIVQGGNNLSTEVHMLSVSTILLSLLMRSFVLQVISCRVNYVYMWLYWNVQVSWYIHFKSCTCSHSYQLAIITFPSHSLYSTKRTNCLILVDKTIFQWFKSMVILPRRIVNRKVSRFFPFSLPFTVEWLKIWLNIISSTN